mmetsp:Transcript_548/g.1704  ORF Transcript_548/g.1704 Transcript_548/m.1704 type:complete len:447 (-) Transcript_548:142-1482(-)
MEEPPLPSGAAWNDWSVDAAPVQGARRQVTDQRHQNSCMGTLGLVLLGMPSGAIVSSYLASCGYFALRFNSHLLFGLQNLTVYSLHLLVLILQEAFDDMLDKKFGVEQTYGFRMIAVGILSSLLMIGVPLCGSPVAVLILGAFTTFSAVSQLSAATQLSAAIVKGGGMFVSFGCTLGGMLPILTVFLVNFHPGCSKDRAMAFYVVTAVFGVLCLSFWVVKHFFAVRHDSLTTAATPVLYDKDEGGTGSSLLSSAYRTMSQDLPRMESYQDKRTWAEDFHGIGAKAFTLTSLGLLICMTSGFMVVPLFTLAKPQVAQKLFLLKCLGDFVGRVMAIAHAWVCKSRGFVGAWVRYGSVVLIAVRVVLSAIVMWQLCIQTMGGLSWLFSTALVLIFSFGGYSMLMLDLDSQLRSEGRSGRKTSQRWNLLMQFLGEIVGVSIGICIIFLKQ